VNDNASEQAKLGLHRLLTHLSGFDGQSCGQASGQGAGATSRKADYCHAPIVPIRN